jgi:hypothetical protein
MALRAWAFDTAVVTSVTVVPAAFGVLCGRRLLLAAGKRPRAAQEVLASLISLTLGAGLTVGLYRLGAWARADEAVSPGFVVVFAATAAGGVLTLVAAHRLWPKP